MRTVRGRAANFIDILETDPLVKMAVYVDNLRDYGWRHGPSCHLIADALDELIEFALSIGLRREWFQPKSSPHFDLNAAGRELAVQNGAVEINQRDLVKKLREFREKDLQSNSEPAAT